MSSTTQTKPEVHHTNTSTSGPAAGKAVAAAGKRHSVGSFHLPRTPSSSSTK